MSIFRSFLVSCFALVFLAACSKSDNNDDGQRISGKLSVAIATAVDSDINDMKAPYQSNNDPANPQLLNSGLLTLQGFVSKSVTGGDSDKERFATSTDAVDYFRVNLQKGQTIDIQAGPQNVTSTLMASLIELENNGAVKNNGQQNHSHATRLNARFIVENSSLYLIEVRAVRSTSRYVLQLKPAQPSATTSGLSGEFIAGELLLQNKPGSVSQQSFSALQSVSSDYPQLVRLNQLNAFSAGQTQVDPLENWAPDIYEKIKTLEQAALLTSDAGIKYAQPNYIYRSQLTPNDTFFNDQWPLQQINAPLAWDISTGAKAGGGDVIIAVLDSGILSAQPDFQNSQLQTNQLVTGYDFVATAAFRGDGDGIDSNPEDPGNPNSAGDYPYHGTHVAGIAAASSNNALGIAGVSWQTKIMPVRVLGITGAGTSYSVVQGLRYAARLSNDSNQLPAQAADVINLSLGSTLDAANAPAEQELFNQLFSLGISVVAAAGNSSTSEPFYPASYEHVISVSATDFSQKLAPYSNFGSKIDIAAPGGSLARDDNFDGEPDVIWSLGAQQQNGTLNYGLSGKQGTSMAAPHVAGVIALMKAIYPQLNANIVESLLANGALTEDIGSSGKDNSFGYGRLDALKAAKAAQQLANGGELPPQPIQLVSDPKTLLVGKEDSLEFDIKNLGGKAPTISVSSKADWLTLVAVSNADKPLDNNTVIRYRAEINRDGLASGFYKTTVHVSANGDDPATIDIELYIQVGDFSSQGQLTQHYVLLLDGGEPIKTVAADSQGNYVFSKVKAGKYQVVAGSDIDVDNHLCDIAETCAIYPLPGEQLIEMKDADISAVDLTVAIKTQTSAQQAGTSNGYRKGELESEGQLPASTELNKTIKNVPE